MTPPTRRDYVKGILFLGLLLAVLGALKVCLPAPEAHETRGLSGPASNARVSPPAGAGPSDPLLEEAQAMGEAVKQYIPIALEADAVLRAATDCALGPLKKVNALDQCKSQCAGAACGRCFDNFAGHPYPLHEKFYDCMSQCDGEGCNRCYRISGGKATDAERAECWESAATRIKQLLAGIPDQPKQTCATQVANAVRAGLTKVIGRKYTKAPARRPRARDDGSFHYLSEAYGAEPAWASHHDANYFWVELPWNNIDEAYDDCSKRLFLCGRGYPGGTFPCGAGHLTAALGLPEKADDPVTQRVIAQHARQPSIQGTLHLTDGRTLNSDSLEVVAPQ